MREKTLRDFLVGKQRAETLNQEAAEATTQLGIRIGLRAESIGSGEHVVTAAQLTRLCDAVGEGTINPTNLEAIAFALITSDFFLWDRDTPDGERVGTVLDDWSGTEIGYPLTPANVSKARHYLITGESTFTPDDHPGREEHMSEFVELRTFSSRNEAEAVQAILSGSEIESHVESDDCGALDPALAFGRGARLLVATTDRERAIDVLSKVAPSDDWE